MDRWSGKIAVITGASSGIGLAVAKALLQHGMIVVGLARRKSKMEDEIKDLKHSGQFHALECDISCEKQVNNAFSWVKDNLKTVHVLINNAGIVKCGKVDDLQFDELKQVMDVNFNGLLLCSKLAIKMMKEGGHDSRIIMISSTAGLRISPVPAPFSSNIYAATKFAVKALATILEKENYGGNIRVTNISPGAVKTEIIDKMSKEIPMMGELDLLEAEDIADAVLYVLGTPSRVLIEELTIKPPKAPY